MNQEKIWDHFQNEGQSEAFSEARPKYIARMLNAGQKVLNIGIGNGYLEEICVGRSIDIHVLDPNERAITRARERHQLGDKAQAGFAQKNPFKESYFDMVVMSEVLEHLGDEVLKAALTESNRVLKPGGGLWVSTPYKENLNMVQVACPNCGEVFHRFGHRQSFDKEKLTKILQDAGFSVEKCYVTTFVDWSRPGVWNLFKSLIKLTLAKLGESISDPHVIAIARSNKQ